MKQIPLTQGQYALVDDADYDWLNQWNWCANLMNGNFYVVRMSSMKNGKRHIIRMHRQILELEYGDKRQGDHVNHITLDNQRENLRICTLGQNQMNRVKQPNTSSQFKGVSWYKRHKKWRVHIRIDKITKHIGLFVSEKEAALAYNEAAKKHYGEFANLNHI